MHPQFAPPKSKEQHWFDSRAWLKWGANIKVAFNTYLQSFPIYDPNKVGGWFICLGGGGTHSGHMLGPRRLQEKPRPRTCWASIHPSVWRHLYPTVRY